MDEEYKTQIMKKEIETLENITTVLKLIIWSFSRTTFNCNPTTDDGLSVTIEIVWFCFFFLCKIFWNVVKTKLISNIDTQNPLNLNKKNTTMNTKKQSKYSNYSNLLTIVESLCKSVLVIAFHIFLWGIFWLNYK